MCRNGAKGAADCWPCDSVSVKHFNPAIVLYALSLCNCNLYHCIQCEVSLDNLEKKLSVGRFSSDAEEAEDQRKNFLICISAVTEPVLNTAATLLRKRFNIKI